MSEYLLSFKPAVGLFGQHDPSAALFADGNLVFAIEEERLTRRKHATGAFPSRSIQACLDWDGLSLADIDRIILPYDPVLRSKIIAYYLRDAVRIDGTVGKIRHLQNALEKQLSARFFPTNSIKNRLAEIGTPIPPIELRAHHACHAASAFHPSGFEEAAVFTIDAKGEYDSTVVWHGTPDGIDRLHTVNHPNSWGLFYAIITEYLGYRMFNGEGKVMGLAAYGEHNPEIDAVFREVIETGAEYDVTELTRRWGTDHGIRYLEELFDRPAKDQPTEFNPWEQDFAFTAQQLMEESVAALVDKYCRKLDTNAVCLAGGVALNCKMNKRIMELEVVDDTFIQPVAHDAGLALGGGWIDQRPATVSKMDHVYWGPEYDVESIQTTLELNKLNFERPEQLERIVAEYIADGALVGWFQGRLELGPRALGNRSILADPQDSESRDRVNRFVKNREEWRPFSPSMLEDVVSEYLVNPSAAPFMIRTFDVKPEKWDEIPAVLHPNDRTTRPQTVRKSQNPRYYRLLEEFYKITGVGILLNTSFNDNGEPIVNTPLEAIKDFFGMGLDILVIEDLLVPKPESKFGQSIPEPASDICQVKSAE